MNKEMIITGKIRCIKDKDSKYINNIDTDMIFHNAHLAITDINEMGQYAFGNLEGYKDYPKKAEKGEILIVGNNFGAGSSRQQAVDCFTALGVSLIIAGSFGAIYKRNAINSAMPILSGENILNANLKDGDEITVDLMRGLITNTKTNTEIVKLKPFSDVQARIYQAGNLFKVETF